MEVTGSDITAVIPEFMDLQAVSESIRNDRENPDTGKPDPDQVLMDANLF